MPQILSERFQRDQLAFNGQPVHQLLLQCRQSLKLLGQELANAVKRRETFGQKGGDVAAKEFMHRLGDDLESQRIARVALHQLAPDLLVAKESFVAQHLLARRQGQAAQPEQAHGSLAASEDTQIRELLATGQQQATVMGGLGYAPDQCPIPFIALAVATLQYLLLEQRFQVVEHQQTASLLQEFEQEGERLVVHLREVRVALLCNGRDPVEQEVVQSGSIVQGTPEHAVKVGRHLLHEFDGQRGLADAAHAQHGHQAALVGQQPAFQFGQFVAASIQRGHVQRFTPIAPGRTRGGARWGEAPLRRYERLPLFEQGRKPLLIKAADAVWVALMQLLPEDLGLVLLVPRCKHAFVEVELDQLLQINLCGVVAATFPVANTLLRHPHLERHLFLSQTGSLAQNHEQLCEVKVALFVAMTSTHVSPLLQACSAQGKNIRGRLKKSGKVKRQSKTAR